MATGAFWVGLVLPQPLVLPQEDQGLHGRLVLSIMSKVSEGAEDEEGSGSAKLSISASGMPF